MAETRMRQIEDVTKGQIYFEEITVTMPVPTGIEWETNQCLAFQGEEPLCAAYAETEAEARDRAETLVRALGFEVPERVEEEDV